MSSLGCSLYPIAGCVEIHYVCFCVFILGQMKSKKKKVFLNKKFPDFPMELKLRPFPVCVQKLKKIVDFLKYL